MKNSSNIRELYFTYTTSAYDFKKQTLKEMIFGNAVTNFIQINFYMKVCFSKIFTTSIAYFRKARDIFFFIRVCVHGRPCVRYDQKWHVLRNFGQFEDETPLKIMQI